VAEDRLFDRRCRIKISAPANGNNYNGTLRDELEISTDETDGNSLRITFKIELKDSKEPNTSEIAIYNLNKDSRALIQKKGSKVTLDAGYSGSGVSRLFIGDLRIGDNKYQGVSGDWVSTLKLGDGERAWRHARVKQSFGPKTGAGDVLRYMGNASGLQLGNIPDVLADLLVTYDQGYSVNGQWSTEMTKFCKSIGYNYSIQNQTLQVLLPGKSVNANGLIPEISVDSGLIDTPEIGTPEKKGKPFLIKFKALLQPTQIGALVKLKSRAHDGNVLIKKVIYSGDTMGGDWFVNYEGVISDGRQ